MENGRNEPCCLEQFEEDKKAHRSDEGRSGTSAALYLCQKVDAAVESVEVGDIDDYLMKMNVGIATGAPTEADTGEPMTPCPIRIGTFTGAVENNNPPASTISMEFPPNMHIPTAGTIYLYAQHDKGGITDFG